MSGPSISAQPKQLFRFNATTGTVTSATQYVLPPFTGMQALSGAGAPWAAFWLDPDDLALYDKATYLELEAVVWSGGVAPGTSFYLSLFPVATLAGLAAAPTITVGAEVAGSRTPTVATPAANSASAVFRSGSFPVPAAGLYVVVATFLATGAATSNAQITGTVNVMSR